MLSVYLVKSYSHRKAASCQDPKVTDCVAAHSLQIVIP